MRRCFISFAVMMLLVPGSLRAQNPPARVDTLVSIIAVVGDSIITNGELQQALDLYEGSNNQPLPPPGPERDRLISTLLQDRINSLLIVQAALRDTTIRVTDEEVRSTVERQINQVMSNMGGSAAFEAALVRSNLTPDAYRELLSTQERHQRLTNQYISKVFAGQKPPPVTDQEIRAFFEGEATRGGAPTLPPSITFDQIVIPVTPSDSALAVAKTKADSVYRLITEGGEDFAQVARRFGEDGTRELGGDLGWFRPGTMVLDFERAAFNPYLRPGDVSPPVLTQYGYHVIKLEKIRGPERQARHILIRPILTDADRDTARVLAERVVEQIRGGAPFDSLRRVHGDADEIPRLGPVARDSLPGEYRESLASVEVGQLVGPFLLAESGGNPPKWAIARIVRIDEARPATVEDYRADIQQRLAREKLYAEVIADLRRRTHVEIRGVAEPDGK